MDMLYMGIIYPQTCLPIRHFRAGTSEPHHRVCIKANFLGILINELIKFGIYQSGTPVRYHYTADNPRAGQWIKLRP